MIMVFTSGMGQSGFLTTNTDNQDLSDVLSNGADAGGVAITNVLDPTNAQDVATKNYVDSQADADDQDLSLTGTDLSLTNDATSVDLSPFLDDTDDQTLSEVLAFGDDAGALAITNFAGPDKPAGCCHKELCRCKCIGYNHCSSSGRYRRGFSEWVEYCHWCGFFP